MEKKTNKDKMFKATVNNQHNFDLQNDTVNGDSTQFDCKKLPNGKYHIILNNKSFNADVLDIDRNAKTVSLLIEKTTFNVEIKDDFDLLLSKMGMDKKAGDVISEIKSPMPGLVLEIKVNPGDTVEKGDALMVLEAMKMENVIAAPNDGVVSEVAVKAQDKVDKNQLLVKFQ